MILRRGRLNIAALEREADATMYHIFSTRDPELAAMIVQMWRQNRFDVDIIRVLVL